VSANSGSFSSRPGRRFAVFAVGLPDGVKDARLSKARPFRFFEQVALQSVAGKSALAHRHGMEHPT